jgi:branched-chain amino acid aminotransferase
MRELDDRKIGSGGPGPVTKKLQAAYFKVIRGERPEYARWLSYL